MVYFSVSWIMSKGVIEVLKIVIFSGSEIPSVSAIIELLDNQSADFVICQEGFGGRSSCSTFVTSRLWFEYCSLIDLFDATITHAIRSIAIPDEFILQLSSHISKRYKILAEEIKGKLEEAYLIHNSRTS